MSSSAASSSSNYRNNETGRRQGGIKRKAAEFEDYHDVAQMWEKDQRRRTEIRELSENLMNEAAEQEAKRRTRPFDEAEMKAYQQDFVDAAFDLLDDDADAKDLPAAEMSLLAAFRGFKREVHNHPWIDLIPTNPRQKLQKHQCLFENLQQYASVLIPPHLRQAKAPCFGMFSPRNLAPELPLFDWLQRHWSMLAFLDTMEDLGVATTLLLHDSMVHPNRYTVSRWSNDDRLALLQAAVDMVARNRGWMTVVTTDPRVRTPAVSPAAAAAYPNPPPPRPIEQSLFRSNLYDPRVLGLVDQFLAPNTAYPSSSSHD